ncbi:protein of unknown function [Candidatus Methylocalor cossyra]|uniref:Uncharacterized protein n=1 Tax=Candidatus Methylocalor cossyra TaxID=3108543 RepID=A0ABM9NHA3_9GAMM
MPRAAPPGSATPSWRGLRPPAPQRRDRPRAQLGALPNRPMPHRLLALLLACLGLGACSTPLPDGARVPCPQSAPRRNGPPPKPRR